MGTIVVGVDGSPGSYSAAQWAAREARLRGDRLVLAHGWYVPATLGLADAVGPIVDWTFLEQAARSVVHKVRGSIDEDGIVVEELLVQGHPVPALLSAAEGADLLVVGSRGLGGFSGMLLGSVSQGVLHNVACPVTVVPSKPAVPPRADPRLSQDQH